MRTIQILLAMLCSIVIAACGSSGGVGDDPPLPVTYSITGAVSGEILVDVRLDLTGAATAFVTTDASGNYSFANLANGNYTITPSKTGYTFNPASTDVTISAASISGTNFVATAASTNTFPLNDTGTTASQCYRAGSNTLLACNDALATGLNNAQDGMKGRDANAATNSNADGKLGFSFTAVSGGCVLDNVTGLMWEVKTTMTNTYTNYRPSDGVLYGTATDASGFVTAVNAVTLCGFSDWRLPTVDELQSIVDYSVAAPGPTVDATWFPNTRSENFWSASSYVSDSTKAWFVFFRDGYVDKASRASARDVRLVRTNQ